MGPAGDERIPGVGDAADLDDLGPRRVGTAGCCRVHHLLFVVGGVETESGNRGGRVGRSHERLADQAHADTNLTVPIDVGRGRHSREGAEGILRHRRSLSLGTQVVIELDSSLGQLLRSPIGGGQIHLKGVEVAIVHPNHPSTGIERHVQLRLTMDLHQGFHPDLPAGIDEDPEQIGRRHRHDEEDGVGPVGGGLVNLVRAKDELLPEDGGTRIRPVRRGQTGRAQIVQRTPEPVLLGQHRNDRRAGAAVGGGLRGGRGIGVDEALGRAGALELGRQAHGRGPGLDDGAQVEHRAVLGVELGRLTLEVVDRCAAGSILLVVQYPHGRHLLQHAQLVVGIAVAEYVAARVVARGGSAPLNGFQRRDALGMRVAHDQRSAIRLGTGGSCAIV
mmetsp:Transcript_19400/g.55833  ORF Transcript_19400/g.55833 Transcript_19400/m.55833 type:complete len:390 (+) Transcript_19400:793-1962(+)